MWLERLFISIALQGCVCICILICFCSVAVSTEYFNASQQRQKLFLFYNFDLENKQTKKLNSIISWSETIEVQINHRHNKIKQYWTYTTIFQLIVATNHQIRKWTTTKNDTTLLVHKIPDIYWNKQQNTWSNESKTITNNKHSRATRICIEWNKTHLCSIFNCAN